MHVKKYTIYSAINPHHTKEVSARERKEYLKCRFWKNTRHEAWIFFYCYFPHSAAPTLCRLLLVLSGRLFKSNGFEDAIKIAWALNEQKIHHKLDIALVDEPIYKKIIEIIDTSYPRGSSLDDILLWAKDKRLITHTQANSLSKKIASINDNVLNHEGIAETVVRDTLNLLVENPMCDLMSYDDAQQLLFPNYDLFDELKDLADYSEKGEHFYFHTKILMKRLMQQGHLSEQLTEEFRTLKVESIKESMAQYGGPFNSLHKLIQQGADRDDLLYEALQDKPLYWKYPKDCQCKRNMDNRCICSNGVRWEEIKPWVKHDITAKQRLDGFGQLKKIESDDTFQCQFGGLTINMLRHNKWPKTAINHYQIELVPTEEEIVYGLQPYIKVFQSELMTAIADDRLGFLESQSLPQVKTKTKQNNQKKPNKLHLLIQKILINSENKEAEIIWRQIWEDRKKYEIWLDKINPWEEGRDVATITWGNRKTTSRTLKRSAFETYVSQLNTGKRPFAEEKYDELYED